MYNELAEVVRDRSLEKTVQEKKVGIAEYQITFPPGKLVALGLGSCVGVVLIDRVIGVSGMIHIMLPESRQFSHNDNPFKYADTGIPLLLEEVLKKGANKKNLFAKLAGGAQMFNTREGSTLLNIGEKNIDRSRQVLNELGIRITGEDTGGRVGRTMILDASLKKVFVRTIGRDSKEI